MDEDLSTNDGELLALFLEEAGDRVERILELASGTDGESSPAQLRRELHALKGASRMMGLAEIAEACHRAEDLFEGIDEASRADLEIQLERVRSLVESLAKEKGVPAEPPTSQTGDETVRMEETTPRREELRVASNVIDDLADRGTRLRVVSVAAEGLADRIFRLATLAERGVGERDPQQVLATLATSLRQVAMEFETGHRIFRRLSDRQLDSLLRLQVQPLKPFLRNLASHARELATSLGKKVEVRVKAGDAQLDRRIVNALREAFLHLVRNAVDHGIEIPEERTKAGKSATGHIRIEASEEGDRVRIRVADDGRGIDVDSVIRTAVEHGFVDPDAGSGIGTAEALGFLFRPGFTTRQETSEISGRGIGLDAVAASVRSVGGDVWMDSEVRTGTEVTVEVPVARRGERVLVVGVGQYQVAVPAAPVRAYRRVAPDMIEKDRERRSLRVREEFGEACFLADLFAVAPTEVGVMVEMTVAGRHVVLVADSILGEEEVMVRPLSPTAGVPDYFEGIALLAGGRPVPILSLARVAQRREQPSDDAILRPAAATPIHVLLVDDSRVTREMIRRILEDAGFKVTGVGSAEDAMLALDRASVDCVVTDIEMPETDGLDLTRLLRAAPEHADLPIVVVSTLDRPSDRLAGLEAGADAYLTKQGLDVRELVALINRVGGGG